MTKTITVTPVHVADLHVEGEPMPVYVHVIDHPDGRVLVDTGMTELHPLLADMDPRLWPLSEQDLDLAGIDIVVNTHLHADHCGGNHLFAGKPIYVQRQELDDARSEDDYTIREWVDAPGVEYVPVDGELELLPGLRLVPAPGHTRGTQVVVVETGGRPVVIARRRGGLVRRARRAHHRRPAAGARARPRAGLARARARAVATPHPKRLNWRARQVLGAGFNLLDPHRGPGLVARDGEAPGGPLLGLPLDNSRPAARSAPAGRAPTGATRTARRVGDQGSMTIESTIVSSSARSAAVVPAKSWTTMTSRVPSTSRMLVCQRLAGP